jgi:hypothetical protein
LHGKQGAVELIVRVLACVAAGLGLRATARGLAGAPHTGLQWLVDAAEPLEALAKSFLCDVPIRQRPRDERSAVLRAGKDDARAEAEALQRLERAPPWVWTALDPTRTLLLVMDVGPRPLAMAPGVVHQVALWLAPASGPLFLTDGLTE